MPHDKTLRSVLLFPLFHPLPSCFLVSRAESTPMTLPRSTPSISQMSWMGWPPIAALVPWKPPMWAPPALHVLLVTTSTEILEPAIPAPLTQSWKLISLTVPRPAWLVVQGPRATRCQQPNLPCLVEWPQKVLGSGSWMGFFRVVPQALPQHSF